MTQFRLVEETVVEYHKTHGTGKPSYIGNWKEFLPLELSTYLRNYNWNSVVERNYEGIKQQYNDSAVSDYHSDIGHFNSFKSTDHIRWKIMTPIADAIDLSQLNIQLKKHLSVYKIWVTQVEPGCCIPQHLDTVESFVKEYKIKKENVKDIKRFVILPENIESWHHLWYGNTILSTGVAGDAWQFNFWEPHGGSNLGSTSKFTIQIIGI